MRVQFSIATVLLSLVGATQQQEAGANDIFPTRSLIEQTPTFSSIFDCTNDHTFRLNGNKKKDCGWVGEKRTRYRCKLRDKGSKRKVLALCPLTCKKKCAPFRTNAPSPAPTPEVLKFCYQDDPKFRFKGNPKKDCLWARQYPTGRCGKKDQKNEKRVRESCPSACNLRCVCKNTRKFKVKGEKK